MECPHVEECVKITAPPMNNESPSTAWRCRECQTEESPWLCLSCGAVSCGRYVKGHGLNHYQEEEKHCVSMDCNSTAVFCYTCDDFAVNDTSDSKIDILRQQVVKLSWTENGEEELKEDDDSSGDEEVDLTCSISENCERVQEESYEELESFENNVEQSLDSTSITDSQQTNIPNSTVQTELIDSPVELNGLDTLDCQQNSEESLLLESTETDPPESIPKIEHENKVQDMETADCHEVIPNGLDCGEASMDGSHPQSESGCDESDKYIIETSICLTNTLECEQENCNKSEKDESIEVETKGECIEGDVKIDTFAEVEVLESTECDTNMSENIESTVPVPICADSIDITKQIDFKENDLSETKEHKSSAKKENVETKTLSHRKENYVRSRRRKSSEAAENSKKRLKTDITVKSKPRTSGLRNLGNTCFMNAVLQSLSNIQSFCGYIKKLPSLEDKMQGKKIYHSRKCKDGDDVFLVEELRKTLVSLWNGNKTAISPESLFSVIWKVVPRFRGYQQQDAHEFMRYLLDRLHTELLTLLPYPNSKSPYIGPKGKSTIVTAIFGGILQNEVTCLICGMESKKHDPFLDLSLDIPNHFIKVQKSKEDPLNRCHLADCLSSFIEVEELEASELYLCSNCKIKQRSTKRFWIRRLPNVLCLHLKRFRWNQHFRVKIDTHIDFPIKGLNMNSYVLNNLHETRNSCGGSNNYDLAAVIVHHGSGAGSGHYTSYAIHEGRWYHFNDSTVTACEEETVRKCKAYILFYIRQELKLPEYLRS